MNVNDNTPKDATSESGTVDHPTSSSDPPPVPAKKISRIEIVKLILPIVTFILGCLFTTVLHRTARQNEVKQESIREVVRISRDWYNQVHRLSIAQENGTLSTETDPAVYDYVHNRLLLPELLFHLKVLKKNGDCVDLVAEIETFLMLVTDYKPKPMTQKNQITKCRELITFFSDQVQRTKKLENLDSAVQRIATEAADLTK